MISLDFTKIYNNEMQQCIHGNKCNIKFFQGFSPASNQAVIVQPTQSAPYIGKEELDEEEIDWDKLL